MNGAVNNPGPAASKTHIPVLIDRVLDALEPQDGGTYVDATFGGGGYARAMLEAAACVVFGIDRDAAAVAGGVDMKPRYGDRLTLIGGRYSDMVHLLAEVGVDKVDGVAMDLGLSSMQIDNAKRGFSFRADGPLDMRMGDSGATAADVVNTTDEKDLADIIYRFGEERASRRVAKAIVETRAQAPITRTGQLADLVRRAVPRSRDGIDPATRTFQALRIFVNDELGELSRGLSAAEALLGPGGRLAVVSFHSLEDRRVKDFLRDRSGTGPRPSRHLPDRKEKALPPTFRLIGRGATKPTAAEIAANSRARSARLRAAERTQAPTWPDPAGNARKAA